MIENNYYEELEGAIAVIGMSGAFPKAKNIEEYWHNLINGRSSIDDLDNEELCQAGIPEELYNNPHYVKKSASLEGAKEFDPTFFGYTPAESRLMDPQHRLFLEHSWKCLEDGNILPNDYKGLIGVFGGCSQNNYLLKNLINSTQADKAGAFQMMIGNDKDYLTTKVSYKLNLRGPSITMQTACSTSLTAIQQGCLSLINYQSDMVLCGGASVNIPYRGGYLYQDGLIFSPKGECRTFDSEADGTVFGDGVGVVLLKRLEEALEDNDNIYAVIRGSAINNDGSEKVGYSAPSVKAQAEVVATALAVAEVPAETIGYVEAHGTGTLMGDPIELAALTDAFRMTTKKKGFCTIGSVKPNIGHLDAAAGVAGFIKTVLILNKGKIPPQINYQKPNPALNIEGSPFIITPEKKEWIRGDVPRRAGISALGVGGTNIHLVLEEFIPPKRVAKEKENRAQLLVFSAKSKEALTNIKEAFDTVLSKNDNNAAAMARTLYKKRVPFPFRDYLVLSEEKPYNRESFLQNKKVSQAINIPPIAFLFTGQGSQYPQMGRGLYENIKPIRRIMDECFTLLIRERELYLKGIIFPENEEEVRTSEEKLRQTTYTQPSLFILEYALASYLLDLGLKPAYLLGHSLGEYTAACLSGLFTLKEALCLVADRGRIMQTAPQGSMISLPLSPEEVSPFLNENLQIAVINTPQRCVLSGTYKAVNELKELLDKQEMRSSILKTSHAYHSFMMEDILEDFAACFENITFGELTLPLISNLTGKEISRDELGRKEYWVEQLRKPVNFTEGIGTLIKNEDILLLEVGPGNTLSTLAKSHKRTGRKGICLSTLPNHKQKENDFDFFLGIMGNLWKNGVKLNWDKLIEDDETHYPRLPSYEFSRESYWIEPENVVSTQNDVIEEEEYTSPFIENDKIVEKQVFQIWSELFGVDLIEPESNFYDMGGHSVLATQLLAQINETFGIEIGLGALLMTPTPTNSLKVVREELLNKEEKSSVREERKTVLPMMFPVQMGEKERTPLFMVSGLYFNRYYQSEKEGQKKYEEDYFRYFSTLVKNIGTQQPIYGFRPRGIFLNETPHRNVQEMAADYIKVIKNVQPEGPYFLGGECIGGIVAYEMAQQLLEAGEKVKHLILMDTFYPRGRSLLIDTLQISRDRFKEELSYKEISSRLKRIGLRILKMQEFVLPLNKKQKAYRQVNFGNMFYLNKLRQYKPKYYEDPNISLLANREWLDAMSPTLEWSENYIKHLNIIPIPGTHVSRLTEHGHITGKHIRDILEKE
jgi:phthiocerol/phenolphthiocerol synthesis type-I polyketide synthase E